MKNKELNLCKILKDCPKGARLYSTVFGEVQFDGISEWKGDNFPIMLSKPNDVTCFTLRADGCPTIFKDAECCLFPSKDNRDWSSWKNPKPKPKPKVERFDPKTLKPFDKVLVKYNYEGERWVCNLFSDILPNGEIHCIGIDVYECIPYNDDTKHLVGTTDEASEYYRYWED